MLLLPLSWHVLDPEESIVICPEHVAGVTNINNKSPTNMYKFVFCLINPVQSLDK